MINVQRNPLFALCQFRAPAASGPRVRTRGGKNLHYSQARTHPAQSELNPEANQAFLELDGSIVVPTAVKSSFRPSSSATSSKWYSCASTA